jgi:ribosome maturation factor RimP
MSGQNDSYRHAEGGSQHKLRGSVTEAVLRRIAEPILSSLGLVLVDAEVRGSGRNSVIRLVIEHRASNGEPEQTVSLEDCERAHVLVGHALDVEDPVPHAYVLEVSSPGLDRPILKASDYVRFQGRLARFQLASPMRGQSIVIGRIQGFDGARVSIETQGTGHGRGAGVKRRVHEPIIITLPLQEIRQARLEVEFS